MCEIEKKLTGRGHFYFHPRGVFYSNVGVLEKPHSQNIAKEKIIVPPIKQESEIGNKKHTHRERSRESICLSVMLPTSAKSHNSIGSKVRMCVTFSHFPPWKFRIPVIGIYPLCIWCASNTKATNVHPLYSAPRIPIKGLDSFIIIPAGKYGEVVTTPGQKKLY